MGRGKERGMKAILILLQIAAVMGNFLSRDRVMEEVRDTQVSFLYFLAGTTQS